MPVATAEKNGLLSKTKFQLLPAYSSFVPKEAYFQILQIKENCYYLLEITAQSVEGNMNVAFVSVWKHSNSGNILKGKIFNLAGKTDAYIDQDYLYVKLPYYTSFAAREMIKGTVFNIKAVDIDDSTLTKLQ